MARLTPTELRTHVTTSLVDAALQRILDDLYDEIEARYGLVGVNVSERFSDVDGSDPIVLRRKATAIVSITEELDAVASVTRVLAATDYRVVGYTLVRLGGGTYPASGWPWYGTTVVYTPVDDTTRRKMAVVDAAKLELGHSAFASERIGDYSYSKGGGQGGKSLDEERAAIFRRRLAPKAGVVFR